MGACLLSESRISTVTHRKQLSYSLNVPQHGGTYLYFQRLGGRGWGISSSRQVWDTQRDPVSRGTSYTSGMCDNDKLGCCSIRSVALSCYSPAAPGLTAISLLDLALTLSSPPWPLSGSDSSHQPVGPYCMQSKTFIIFGYKDVYFG